DAPEQRATEVLAVDVIARRVVGRQRFDGVVQGYARLPRGLALVVSPANAIGRARLVVSDANAGLRAVTLAEINAGFKQLDDTDGSGPRMEQAVPGIAADRVGRGGGPGGPRAPRRPRRPTRLRCPRRRAGGRDRGCQPGGHLPSARAV